MALGIPPLHSHDLFVVWCLAFQTATNPSGHHAIAASGHMQSAVLQPLHTAVRSRWTDAPQAMAMMAFDQVSSVLLPACMSV